MFSSLFKWIQLLRMLCGRIISKKYFPQNISMFWRTKLFHVLSLVTTPFCLSKGRARPTKCCLSDKPGLIKHRTRPPPPCFEGQLPKEAQLKCVFLSMLQVNSLTENCFVAHLKRNIFTKQFHVSKNKPFPRFKRVWSPWPLCLCKEVQLGEKSRFLVKWVNTNAPDFNGVQLQNIQCFKGVS